MLQIVLSWDTHVQSRHIVILWASYTYFNRLIVIGGHGSSCINHNHAQTADSVVPCKLFVWVRVVKLLTVLGFVSVCGVVTVIDY